MIRARRNFSHVTTLRVKIAFHPCKQTLIPARAGTYRFTGQFCSKRWRRFGFAKLGPPRPVPVSRQFIDVPARPSYSKKLKKIHLSDRYLAGKRAPEFPVIRYRSSPPRCRTSALLPAQVKRGPPSPAQGTSAYTQVRRHSGPSRRSRKRGRPCCMPPSQQASATVASSVHCGQIRRALARAGSINRCSETKRHPAEQRDKCGRLKYRFQR